MIGKTTLSRDRALFVPVIVLVVVIVGTLGMFVDTTSWQVVSHGIKYNGTLAQDVFCAFVLGCPPCPPALVGQCYVLTVDLVRFHGNYYYLYQFTGTFNGITKHFATLFTNSTIYCSYPVRGIGITRICPPEVIVQIT